MEQVGEQARQLCMGLEARIKGTLHAAQKWVQLESGADSENHDKVKDDSSLFDSQFSCTNWKHGGMTQIGNGAAMLDTHLTLD